MLVTFCGNAFVSFRLYSLQQRHFHVGDCPLVDSTQELPPKPSWLTIQNGQNVGSVLVVMIPYLDVEQLRVYASSDRRLVVGSSQLSHQSLKEFFGPIEDAAIGCGYRSVLETVAGNKIPMRPPRIAAPPYCSIVQVCQWQGRHALLS